MVNYASCSRHYCTSPDRNEKPGLQKNNFSCPERATKRSSFQDLEKYFYKGGLVMESWNSFKVTIRPFHRSVVALEGHKGHI